MTLKEYYDALTRIVEENPDLELVEIVFACDDEGNDYNYVSYEPTIGYYDRSERQFTTDQWDENHPKVVCIN